MITMQLYFKNQKQAQAVCDFANAREDQEWYSIIEPAEKHQGSIMVHISFGDDPAPEDFAELARLAKQYS